MGIVYVVYGRAATFREPFAAKTFQDEIFSRNPGVANRFRQEAVAWTKLDVHQNVAQARFVEIIEDKPYIFLEYVSGGDLSRWIGTPHLTQDVPQVLRFAIQFCDGMTHVLSKGIKAHRDIKPQNCLITGDGSLKVTDFGLSKVFDEAILEEQADESVPNVQTLSINLTHTGVAAGTPAYMAPEQFEDTKHVNVRADIYSFGVMLFEMITGKRPFIGRSWQELEWLHKNQRIPSLSTHPATLGAIVHNCLAKGPADRFVDFGEVRKELAETYSRLTGEVAPQPVTGPDLDAIDQNNKGASLNNLGRNEDSLACYDSAIAINPRFEEAWSNKGTALRGLGRNKEAIVCYDRAIALNPRNVAFLYNKGVALRELGQTEEAIAYYDRALELNPRYEDAWINKGAALGKLGRNEEGVVCFNRLLEINPLHEKAWNNKGVTLDAVGRSEEAIACYDSALEINPRSAETLSNKGGALATLGRHKEAIVCYDLALGIDPRYADAWSNRASSLGALGLDGEIAGYDRALELNPRYSQAWYNKGLALRELGRAEEAIVCYDRALEFNPRYAEAWNNKGTAFEHLGRYKEALACYDRTLELNEQIAQVWYNKGALLANFFNLYEDALPCFERALSLGHPQAAAVILQLRDALE